MHPSFWNLIISHRVWNENELIGALIIFLLQLPFDCDVFQVLNLADCLAELLDDDNREPRVWNRFFRETMVVVCLHLTAAGKSTVGLHQCVEPFVALKNVPSEH